MFMICSKVRLRPDGAGFGGGVMGAGGDRRDVDQWHLVRNGKYYGPYNFSILVGAVGKGILSPRDKVWRPGWDDWRPAESVPGLFAPVDIPVPAASQQKSELPITRVSAFAAGADLAADIKDQVAKPRGEPVGQVANTRNYFVRHWRGELSLPVSYWVNGLLATIAASTTSFGFITLIEGGEVRAGAPMALALICFILLLLALSAWQMVGIWRSATRRSGRGSRVWPVLAKASVIIGIVRVAIELVGASFPVVSEHVRIAIGDQRFGESRFRLLRDGTELEFFGGINVGAADELARMLDAAPQVRVLHLNSVGGRIAEADLMAAHVRKRHLITYVSERCDSACTHVFLAGSERWLSRQATLGFHQPSSSFGDGRKTTAGHVEDERRRLRSMGLPDAFVAEAMNTPNDKIWRPTHEELLAARAISGVSDGSRFAASGYVASLPAAEREQAVLKMPLYASLKRADPRAFEEIMKQLAEGYRRGASEEEIAAIARALISKSVRQQVSYAPDSDVLKAIDILIGYMEGLRWADPESCVALEDPSKGARLKSDLAKLFPLIADRELSLNQSIIESGANERRALPTTKEIEPYMAKVSDRLARRSELRFDLIDKPTLTPQEFEPFCEAVLAFYQEIRRLPAHEATAVLRNIYADAGK
jgi:hypothetical protein